MATVTEEKESENKVAKELQNNCMTVRSGGVAADLVGGSNEIFNLTVDEGKYEEMHPQLIVEIQRSG